MRLNVSFSYLCFTGKLARKASKERKNKVLKVRGKAKTEVRSGKAVAKKKKD
jgi:hypothetical protein